MVAKIKRFIKSTIGAEIFAYYKTERKLFADRRRNRPVFFVHQMGKVGSSTLVKSLKAIRSGRQFRIHYTHFLSPEGMALVEQLETDAFGGWSKLRTQKKRILVKSRILSKHIYAGDFLDRPCKLVSLVRDPVSTNLSGFFYNYHWWPKSLVAMCRSESDGWQGALLEQFLTQYPQNVPADWFDWEMKGVFGVDVFAREFDKDAGYLLDYSQRYPLLLMRLENLNDSLADVICEFFELENFSLQKSNTASEKWYGDLYNKFKATVVFPSTYLDQIYGSRTVRHFYSPSEIVRFRNRWEESKPVGLFSKAG